jgi:hypothetical protein
MRREGRNDRKGPNATSRLPPGRFCDRRAKSHDGNDPAYTYQGSGQKPRRSEKATVKATGLAAAQIDPLVDKSASAKEQASRKRQLLKGPGEFRDVRVDRAKPR